MGTALEDLPLRLATGAFILNSGVGKLSAGDEQAAGLHGFASGTYPMFKDMDPKQFVRLLGMGEVAIGTAVITPLIPTRIAGTALTAFSAGLLGLYLKTPGMREDGSLRPTQQGIPLAKDSWLLGAGLSLLIASRRRRNKKSHESD